MKILQARYPVWANQEQTLLDIEVILGELEYEGFLQHTTSEDADTDYGKELWLRAIGGDFGEIAQYVQAEEDLAEEARMLFESEKEIALKIDADYRLDLEIISDAEMDEVKSYLKYIKPDSEAYSMVARPLIMNRYDPQNTTLEE